MYYDEKVPELLRCHIFINTDQLPAVEIKQLIFVQRDILC